MTKRKKISTTPKQQGVSAQQKFEINQRVRHPEAANDRRQQQEHSGNDQPDDGAGVQPIQPLTLIEGDIQQRETEAGIEETSPVRFRLSFFRLWQRLPRDAEVNQHHHDRREHRAVPEDPAPGQVVHVPGFERGCDVGCEDDVHGVHRDPQQHIAHGQVAQNERKRERVEGASRQACEHQQDQHDRKVGSEWKQHADDREYRCAGQQNSPRAEQTAEVDRERADKHQRGIERRAQPRGLIHAKMQSAAQVRQTDTEQPSGAGCDHRAKQDPKDAQHRMGCDDRGADGVARRIGAEHSRLRPSFAVRFPEA